MFESSKKLGEDITALLTTLRRLGSGRYACLIEPKGVVFDSADPDESGAWMLRRFLEQRTAALFAIPEALAGDGPAEDMFADWERDEFLLAFVNGRVAVVVACPDAEPLKEKAGELIRVLADRLLRFNAAWRVDQKGRGLFFGRAKLDLIVVGRPSS
jgi:hypothetical protein